MRKPTEAERLQIVLHFSGITVDLKTADHINLAYKGYQKLGGKFSIKDGFKVRNKLNKKWPKQESKKHKIIFF